MRTKLRAGKPAEITFTCDFHELVAGDLCPGGPVLLRYDPLRVVPPGESYRFGDPARPITAHLRFYADGHVVDVDLHSPAGVLPCPDVDITGQGSMLIATVEVPADADRVVVWFSLATEGGALVYDSNNGANYRFGFPAHELPRVEATVTQPPDAPADRFEVQVAAAPRIEAVAVSFVLIGDPGCRKHELPLQRTGEAAADGQGLWRGVADVPHGAIVRFKLRYWVEGCQLIDDDAGVHYLAPAPAPDRPPPPPAELIEAAAAWH